MHKYLLLIGLYSINMLSASEALDQPQSSIGRYQMVFSPNDNKLYLLDTSNGHVWRSQVNWKTRYREWEEEISLPPVSMQ